MRANERVKDAPASALKAMFAGIGQLLGMADKLRGKSAAAPEQEAGPAASSGAAQATAAEPAAAEPVAQEAAAESIAPESIAPESIAPEAAPAAAPAAEEPAAAAATGGLPLANYDELTVASLRARLRNLSADQLGQLIDYEKSHAGRTDVITMFERRIAKLAEG